MATKKREAGTRTPVRKYTENKTAIDKGIPCPHCRERYGHTVKNTYPNGNRRRICGKCGLPFMSLRVFE